MTGGRAIVYAVRADVGSDCVTEQVVNFDEGACACGSISCLRTSELWSGGFWIPSALSLKRWSISTPQAVCPCVNQ
jgi:hypothetical protein